MKTLHLITFVLLGIGGLNWGIFGLTGWDIGQLFGGMDAGISRLIYVLVGISALYVMFTHKKDCKICGQEMAKTGMPSA